MDIHTLAVVLGLANLVQAAVLVLLYRSHSSKPGLGCWAAGSCAFAAGFVCNYLRDQAILGPVMIIANNFFFVSGLILLYRGVVRFFGQQVKPRAAYAVCFAFMLTVVYFTLVAPNLQIRRILFSLAVAGFSLLVASALQSFRFYRYRAIDLLLTAFLLNGLFFAWRGTQLIAAVSANGMFAASILEVATYLVALVVSVLWTLGFIMLVSQRALAESSEAREHFELIFNASPNAVLITSLHEGRLVSSNDAFTELTGYTREELLGRTTLDIDIWRDGQVRSSIVEQLNTTGHCKNIELVFNHKDGHQIDGLFSATIISLQGIPHILSVTQDISERKKLEAALQQREAHYRLLTEDVSDVVWKMDSSYHFTYISPADERLRGFRNDEVVGHHVFELMTAEGIEAIKQGGLRRKEAEKCGEQLDQLVFEVQQRCKDGSLVWTEIISVAERDAHGRISGFHGVTRNINQRKLTEMALATLNSQLEALTSTDSLTGLANRRHFDEMLAREYARHIRSGAELSLIMLDIDCFKAFNDTYGHLAGDACLQEISRVLQECASRAADMVARYGGEEFVCILPETDAAGAEVIAERIRLGISSRAIPHQASPVSSCVTASLGVVTAHCSAEGTELELLKQADALLYQAKAQGRNRLVCASLLLPQAEVRMRQVQPLLKLSWKSAFCCGHPAIDTQHMVLVAMANDLLNRMLAGASKAEVTPVITALFDEVGRHFSDEERHLASIGYAGLTEHTREHARLLQQCRELARQFEEDRLVLGELFAFLAHEVVMRHMLDADRAFFPCIQQAQAELAGTVDEVLTYEKESGLP